MGEGGAAKEYFFLSFFFFRFVVPMYIHRDIFILAFGPRMGMEGGE